jgi:hypothetical protein
MPGIDNDERASGGTQDTRARQTVLHRRNIDRNAVAAAWRRRPVRFGWQVELARRRNGARDGVGLERGQIELERQAVVRELPPPYRARHAEVENDARRPRSVIRLAHAHDGPRRRHIRAGHATFDVERDAIGSGQHKTARLGHGAIEAHDDLIVRDVDAGHPARLSLRCDCRQYWQKCGHV